MKLWKAICGFFASAAALLALGSLTAFAAGSVEDVYQAMRDIGLPEYMVQEAKNQYQTMPHDEGGMTVHYDGEDTYMSYIAMAENVYTFEERIWEEIANELGVPYSEVQEYVRSNNVLTTTAPPAQTGAAQPGAAQTGAAQPGGETVTTTTVTVVTNAEGKTLAEMTIEEIRAMLQGMTQEQRAAFFGGLSTADRNAIIKKMTTSGQAGIMQQFTDLAEQYGMHVSVDNIGDGSVEYSIRDEEGNLIDSASVGAAVIDDTGWNLKVPIFGSAGAILLAGTGLIGLGASPRKRKEPSDDA